MVGRFGLGRATAAASETRQLPAQILVLQQLPLTQQIAAIRLAVSHPQNPDNCSEVAISRGKGHIVS